MEQQSNSAPSHGCLVALVLLTGLVGLVACGPAAPIPAAPPPATQQPAVVVEKPPVEIVQAPAENVPVVGSAKATTYHRPTCEWAQKISRRNLVTFSSAETAREKGYRPCRSCNPK